MKNVNNFQIAKVQPQGVAQHLLDFLPISADKSVAFKNVAYKKKRVNDKLSVKLVDLKQNYHANEQYSSRGCLKILGIPAEVGVWGH